VAARRRRAERRDGRRLPIRVERGGRGESGVLGVPSANEDDGPSDRRVAEDNTPSATDAGRDNANVSAACGTTVASGYAGVVRATGTSLSGANARAAYETYVTVRARMHRRRCPMVVWKGDYARRRRKVGLSRPCDEKERERSSKDGKGSNLNAHVKDGGFRGDGGSRPPRSPTRMYRALHNGSHTVEGSVIRSQLLGLRGHGEL
jgi:hypothetical protein